MKNSFVLLIIVAGILFTGGCNGYSNEPLYTKSVKTVYVKMFDNRSFRRDLEYDLTDALAKKIEAETPYKVISSISRADTVLSGYIAGIGESVLTIERSSGRALEKQAEITAQFSWKNLKTGEYILENEFANASASFSEFQEQSFDYAASVAANRLATNIVEQMQLGW